MKKYRLVVINSHGTFKSIPSEASEDQLQYTQNLCVHVAEGNLPYLIITNDAGFTWYINKEILKQSIIAIEEILIE